MASPNADTAVDNDSDPNRPAPQRRESKKHKFRPFAAVRRLFSGGKSSKRSKTSSASTPIPGDEENHNAASRASEAARPTSAPVHIDSTGRERLGVLRQTSVGDNPITSDDSIISPEQLGKTSATSDPKLPKSAFQAELSSKLTKRRSFCSEEDEEDGLRPGLAPPAVTTDVSGGASVKEDLFDSQWTSVVIGAPSPSSDTSVGSRETQGSLDLSEMARTEVLKSDAAKDRISIKPRKTNWHSRKRREGRYSLSLPSLIEVESTNNNNNNNSSSGSGPTSQPGGRPRSEYIDPAILSDFDLHMIPSVVSAVELSGPAGNGSEAKGSESGAAATSPSIATTTTITTTTTSITTSSSNNTLTGAQSDEQSPRNAKIQPDTGALPSQNSKTQRVSFATDRAVDPAESVLAAETVVVQAVGGSTTVQTPREKKGADAVAVNATGSSLVDSSVTAHSSSAALAASSSSSSSSAYTSAVRKKEGLRQADDESEDAFSPRPEYKIRRQQRSKTLPVQQAIVTVQRTASQRGETSSSGHVTKNRGEKLEQVSKSDEPEWLSLARRRSQKHNEEAQQSASSGDAVVTARQSPKSSPHVAVNTTATTTIITTGTITIPSSNVTTPSKTSNFTIASSATARQEAANQSQTGTGWTPRGGSVTIPRSTTTLPANRDGSVKVTPMRPQPSSAFVSTPSLSANISASSSSSSSSPTLVTSVNGEPKTSQSTVTSETRSWKSQSVKTQPTYIHNATSSSSSSAPKPTQSSSATSSLRSSSGPVSSSTTKTDTTRALSTVQASSPQRPRWQTSSSPAWRSEILQRMLDPGDVKIELIERSPSGVESLANGKKTADSGSGQQSSSKVGGDLRDLPSDQCRTSVPARRHSKVMDLLKNFENLQSVS